MGRSDAPRLAQIWRLEQAEDGIVTRTCRRCQRQVVGRVEHSGVWWIRWTCQFGHEHQEQIGPKGLALATVEQRRVDAKTKAFCLTRDRDRQRREKLVLFAAVADKYETWAEEHRPRSLMFRQKALKHLRAAFGIKALTDITAEELEQYQVVRQEAKAAGATVNRELSVLSHLFKLAIKTWKLTKINPVAGTERLEEAQERPRPLTPDEEAALFPVLPAHYKPFVTLALNTGLRLGEIRQPGLAGHRPSWG